MPRTSRYYTRIKYFDTTITYIVTQGQDQFDMPLYNKLPDNLHEVDVIVSGGWLDTAFHHSCQGYGHITDSLLQVAVRAVWWQPGWRRRIRGCRFSFLSKAGTTINCLRSSTPLSSLKISKKRALLLFSGRATRHHSWPTGIRLCHLEARWAVALRSIGWSTPEHNDLTSTLGMLQGGQPTSCGHS